MTAGFHGRKGKTTRERENLFAAGVEERQILRPNLIIFNSY
jgi:hypothetical protein